MTAQEFNHDEGTDMADVFEVLGQDHREVKEMLAQLEHHATTAAGGTKQEMAERKAMAEKLVIEESKHEVVEQMYFWPMVRERLSPGDELADIAIAQENEGKHVLDKLDKLDASEPEFELLLAEFIRAGREHIAYEEEQVWPALRDALTPQEAAELGNRITEAKKTAPTRPHPHTPASPAVLKATGPAAAAADKARDAATGRGESS